MRRGPNEKLNNLMQLLQKEETGPEEKKTSDEKESNFLDNYSINLDIINFKDIHFTSVDSLWGIKHNGRFSEFFAQIDTFDLAKMHIVFNRVMPLLNGKPLDSLKILCHLIH